MLSYLLLVLVLQSPFGNLPVGLKFPFPDLAACQKWMADPTPMQADAPFPLVVVHAECVNESTDPGKPV